VGDEEPDVPAAAGLALGSDDGQAGGAGDDLPPGYFALKPSMVMA